MSTALELELKKLKLPITAEELEKFLTRVLDFEKLHQQKGQGLKLSDDKTKLISYDPKTGKEILARPLSDFY